MRKNALFIFTFLISITLFCAVSYGFRFNIDSPKVVLEINPGKGTTGYITCDNFGYNEGLTVTTYVQDVIYLPDGTNDFVPLGSTAWSLKNWIKVEPKQFKLRANSSQLVRYAVKAPKDASGGRYGVIFFEVEVPPPIGAQTTQPRSLTRIGSIVAVTVRRTARYEAELVNLKAEMDKDGVVRTACVIRNDSNILIRPEGEFVIAGSEGKEITAKSVNPTSGGVLPGTSRAFEAAWDDPKLELDANQNYTVQVTIDYQGDNLLAGQTRLNMANE